MYKECKTKQSILRQRHIENTLLRMMNNRSLHDIKINELCEEADIPRKAFYRYFDSKEDILYALVDHAFEDMVNKCDVVADRNGLIDIDFIEAIFKYWYEHKDLIKALDGSGFSYLVLERSLYWDLKDIAKGTQNLDEEVISHRIFMFTGFYSLIFTWIRFGNKTAREMAEVTIDCLTKPLLPNK